MSYAHRLHSTIKPLGIDQAIGKYKSAEQRFIDLLCDTAQMHFPISAYADQPDKHLGSLVMESSISEASRDYC